MKPKLTPCKRFAMRTMVLLFLYLTTSAMTCFAQSTPKMDSTFATIEGTQAEIDSALKILNDYPDLKSQYELTKKVLTDERKLSNIERAAILEVVGLEEWDYKKVVKRIKKIKRQLFWRPVLYSVGGTAFGLAVGFIRYNL